jgi:hypothetical protein
MSAIDTNTVLDVESKPVTDIEIQVQEVNSSKEENDLDNTLLDDWNAPGNKENPKNWSGCE